MRGILRAGWSALFLFALSIPASAQPALQANEWSHGTTLNVLAGAGTDSSDTGAVAGTSVGWEITPSMAIEGSGYWLDRGPGANAFAAALKLQVGLLVPHKAVHFLEAGVGLYRASFDPIATAVPDFYRRRMAATSPRLRDTFTDPSFVLGGGVNIFVTQHFVIRPDVESMIVRRDGRSLPVTAVAVHVAYHFENHPVTPTRGSR